MTIGFFSTIERHDGEIIIVRSSMRLMAFITTIVGCVTFLAGAVLLALGFEVGVLLSLSLGLAGGGELAKLMQKKEETNVEKDRISTGGDRSGPAGPPPVAA